MSRFSPRRVLSKPHAGSCLHGSKNVVGFSCRWEIPALADACPHDNNRRPEGAGSVLRETIRRGSRVHRLLRQAGFAQPVPQQTYRYAREGGGEGDSVTQSQMCRCLTTIGWVIDNAFFSFLHYDSWERISHDPLGKKKFPTTIDPHNSTTSAGTSFSTPVRLNGRTQT